MEFSKGVVSEYYNGKKPISSNFVQKFEECYNVSLDDFILEKSEDIISNTSEKSMSINLDKDFLNRNSEVAELVTFLNRNYNALRKNELFSLYFDKIEQVAVNDFKEKFLIELNKKNYSKEELVKQILKNTDGK